MTNRSHTQPRWCEIRGTAVLAWQRTLQELAKNTHQDHVLDALEYLLKAPYFHQSFPKNLEKVFRLLPTRLLTRRTRQPVLLVKRRGSDLEAAVLLFEYRISGLRTRCYIPMDEDGYRTVIAPESSREFVAFQAGEHLISNGAFLALVSISLPFTLPTQISPPGGFIVGSQCRDIGRVLSLGDTFEATVGKFSRNTRHNFKRARRWISEGYAADYVEHAAPSVDELAGLNESCSYPVPQRVAKQRLELSVSLANGYVSGLQDHNGCWMSLVGGHREGDMLCLDWQMNRSGLGHLSVATAMRSFLIEREIARGTRSLRFERGTTHPIQNAFSREIICDQVFASGWVGRWLTHLFSRGGKGGPLANVLSSPSFVWHSGSKTQPDH